MLAPADALPLVAEREAYPPGSHTGSVVMASGWFAFYVLVAIHHFMASGN